MKSDGKIIIETSIDTKSFDAQIASLENKLDTLVQEYEVLKNAEPYEGQTEDLIHYEKEIEKTSNQIINLKKQQIKLEQTSNKNWGKVLNNLKKVSLKMLGIASVYGIISKASSSYLSKDTELAEKLQSVWVALGSFLAPVIEGISNVLLKAVGYINEFIKALTGVDYIARANAKAIEKQTKATKDLNKANKQTYDFDVIRTQQETKEKDKVSGLVEIPELNQGIVDKLKDLAHWLKENEDLVKAVGIALVTTFGAIAIAKIIKGITTLIGSRSMLTGISGLAYLLGALATVVLITIIVKGVQEAIEQLKELNDSLSNETSIAEGNTEKIKEMTEAYWENEKQQGANKQMDELFANSLNKTSDGIQQEIDKLEEQKKKLWFSKEAQENLTNTEKEYIKQLGIVNGNYKLLFEQGKLNDKQKEEYAKSLESEMDLTKKLGGDVSELEAQYKKLDGKTYTSKLDLDTSNAQKNADGFFSQLFNGLGTGLSSMWKGLKGAFGNVGKFANGGIVTQPTRAIIGEAGYPEAVVPMTDDYLSTLAQLIGQYGGGYGGGTTNIYLDGRLIQRQMANRENEVRFATNK